LYSPPHLGAALQPVKHGVIERSRGYFSVAAYPDARGAGALDAPRAPLIVLGERCGVRRFRPDSHDNLEPLQIILVGCWRVQQARCGGLHIHTHFPFQAHDRHRVHVREEEEETTRVWEVGGTRHMPKCQKGVDQIYYFVTTLTCAPHLLWRPGDLEPAGGAPRVVPAWPTGLVPAGGTVAPLRHLCFRRWGEEADFALSRAFLALAFSKNFF
jgi:hypothetical protein